jgi:hypothetical protein
MRILCELIKMNKTVVFESIPRDKVWIFKSDGSCRIKNSIRNVDELNDPETFHLYDAKAGLNKEPAESFATLIEFSSTNVQSYKQTDRRVDLMKILYPSTSREEFDNYANIFGVSTVDRDCIVELFGSGKVRSLRTPIFRLEEQIQRAVRAFDYEKLLVYASSYNYPVVGIENPAILLDAFLREENLKKVDLLEKYRFENALWQFSSENIIQRILEKFKNKADEVHLYIITDIFQT